MAGYHGELSFLWNYQIWLPVCQVGVYFDESELNPAADTFELGKGFLIYYTQSTTC